MTTAEAKGEKFDFEAREGRRRQTEDPGISRRRNGSGDCRVVSCRQPKPRPQLLGWLEHQGEHYGKLVTAYRVNGVVPPVSRPK
jgi:hypothetical protein